MFVRTYYKCQGKVQVVIFSEIIRTKKYHGKVSLSLINVQLMVINHI